MTTFHLVVLFSKEIISFFKNHNKQPRMPMMWQETQQRIMGFFIAQRNNYCHFLLQL